MRTFDGFDWEEIAYLMGCTFISEGEGYAEVREKGAGGRWLRLNNNGGEINIFEIKRLPISSVDFNMLSTTQELVTSEEVLADRLSRALRS